MTAVADLYSPIVRGRSDQHYLSVSRLFTLLAGVAQMCVALLLQFQARSALDSALSVAALINGPILGVFLLAAAKRGGRSAALVGMSCGIAAVVTVWLATDVAWPWYTVVGSLTTLIIGSLVAAVLHEGALPATEPSLE